MVSIRRRTRIRAAIGGVFVASTLVVSVTCVGAARAVFALKKELH